VVIKFESRMLLLMMAWRIERDHQISLNSRAHGLTPVKDQAANVCCPFDLENTAPASVIREIHVQAIIEILGLTNVNVRPFTVRVWLAKNVHTGVGGERASELVYLQAIDSAAVANPVHVHLDFLLALGGFDLIP